MTEAKRSSKNPLETLRNKVEGLLDRAGNLFDATRHHDALPNIGATQLLIENNQAATEMRLQEERQFIEKFIEHSLQKMTADEKSAVISLLQNESSENGKDSTQALAVLRETVLWIQALPEPSTESEGAPSPESQQLTPMYELVGMLIASSDHELALTDQDGNMIISQDHIRELVSYINGIQMDLPGFKNAVDSQLFVYELNESGSLVLKLHNPEQNVRILEQVADIWRYAAEVSYQEPSYRVLLRARKALTGKAGIENKTRASDETSLVELLSLVDLSEGLQGTEPDTPSELKLRDSIEKYINKLRLSTQVDQDEVDQYAQTIDTNIKHTQSLLTPDNYSLDARMTKMLWKSLDPTQEIFTADGTFPGSTGDAQATILFAERSEELVRGWDRVKIRK